MLNFLLGFIFPAGAHAQARCKWDAVRSLDVRSHEAAPERRRGAPERNLSGLSGCILACPPLVYLGTSVVRNPYLGWVRFHAVVSDYRPGVRAHPHLSLNSPLCTPRLSVALRCQFIDKEPSTEPKAADWTSGPVWPATTEGFSREALRAFAFCVGIHEHRYRCFHRHLASGWSAPGHNISSG